MSGAPASRGKAGKGRMARSAARLYAVQALYQMDMTGAPAAGVIREFTLYRLGRDQEGVTYNEPDVAFFDDIARGCDARRAEVDEKIAVALSGGWTVGRLEALLRAVLWAGAYELLHRPDVPAKAAINEYVDMARAFFSGKEPGLVNGVLDRIARDRIEDLKTAAGDDRAG